MSPIPKAIRDFEDRAQALSAAEAEAAPAPRP
ncbi:MAG: hypothetical protein K0Q43_238 [Ramlibacter sp.]|jgi:hypothetical protein|nr:hypothetical protein [Ramlibacter sp.]